MSLDHKLDSRTDQGPERKTGKKSLSKKAVAAIVGGVVTVVTVTTATLVAAFGPRGNVSATPAPHETVATAPVTPGVSVSETASPHPTESIQPSATTEPSATESAPQPSATETASPTEDLYDEGAVAEMESQTDLRFYQNPEPLRLMYYFADAYDEMYNTGASADYLNQEMKNGMKLSDYNPLNLSLTVESDPQDVMNSSVYGQALILAQEDETEANKLTSGFVRDPKSAAYKKWIDLYKYNPHIRMDPETANSRTFKVVDSKIFKQENPVSGKEETYMRIETKAGYVSEFVFVPEPALATLNYDETDNNAKTGVWLLIKTEQL